MRRHDKKISLRIPNDLLQQITEASKSLRENRSRFIKRSIIAYLDFHYSVNKSIFQKRN